MKKTSWMADKTSFNRHPASKSKNNVKFIRTINKLIPNIELSFQADERDGHRFPSAANSRDASPTKMKKKKKGKSKMGRPIIVEDIVQENTTVRIPAPLRHAATAKSVADPSLFLASFDPKEITDRDGKAKKVRITVAQCIKPTSRYQNTNISPRSATEATSPQRSEREFEESFNSFYDSPATSPKKKFKSRLEPMKKDPNDPEAHQRLAPNNDASFSSQNNLNLSESETKKLPRFYSSRNKVLAVIEPDTKFCFHGKLRIRILYGAIKIYGACLNSDKTVSTPVEVYAPRAYSPIAIESIESDRHDRVIEKFHKFLTERYADRKIAKRLQSEMNKLDDGWAVAEFENFDNRLTNFLVSYYPVHLFPKIDDPSNHSWIDPRRAEIVLQSNIRYVDNCKQSSIGSRGIDDFADGICYDWDTKAASRTIIAGGKSVGKSTTVRYLVNKLLAKSKAVLVLDLDPGQAEFTPAGCLSLNVVEKFLLGPNFTHLDKSYHQFYIGGIDVSRCISHYVSGVKKLADRIIEDPKLSRLPLVVNTIGFCKGIGWDIINYVIKVIEPTDVVQILSKRAKNNFDDTLSRQVVDRQSVGLMFRTKDTVVKDKPAKHRLHVMYSEAETVSGNSESWKMEPHQQRDLVMIAYLSEIVRNESALSGLSQRTLVPSINTVAPYAVSFSAISVSLAGAFIPQVLSVMNGNIVALCGIEPEVLQSTEELYCRENIVACYPRVLIRPPLSTCYGFGILRGVDMEKERLYVNTPLTSDDMKHVNCLIGCVNLPLSLLQMDQQCAPYTGNKHGLPTSKGSRRGYYRMRRQVDA